MNKMRPCRIIALVLSVVAIALLVVGIYGMTRPMAYDSDYYHTSFYEGEDFNGTMTFHTDNIMVVNNTNFDEEFKSYYYYKDGYIFFALAETEAEYEAEVAAINEDFEGAVNAPFYASKINAYKLTSEGFDGFTTVYLCKSSIMMTVVWAAIELALIGFIFAALNRCKKKSEA